MNGGLIGPEYDAQIRQTILNVRQMRIDSAEHQGKADRPEPSKFAPKYALLLDDLAAAEEFTEAPQTARARLLVKNADATLRESEIVVEVVNRTESSHAEGEYVRLKFIAGEWNILGGGGGVTLAHGVILEQCNAGCSTYRVQRVHRYLKAECDNTGTGTGTGAE